jgi:hypothetical protein
MHFFQHRLQLGMRRGQRHVLKHNQFEAVMLAVDNSDL